MKFIKEWAGVGSFVVALFGLLLDHNLVEEFKSFFFGALMGFGATWTICRAIYRARIRADEEERERAELAALSDSARELLARLATTKERLVVEKKLFLPNDERATLGGVVLPFSTLDVRELSELGAVSCVQTTTFYPVETSIYKITPIGLKRAAIIDASAGRNFGPPDDKGGGAEEE